MPVEFLTDEQVAAYGQWIGPSSRAPLEHYLVLDDDDLGAGAPPAQPTAVRG